MLRDLIDQQTLVTIRPDANARELAGLMDSRNVGCVLVLDAGKPVGIVTDRDIVVRCVSNRKAPLEECQVSDIMTDALVTARDTDGIHDVIRKMHAGKVRRMPVLNEQGKAVGLVSHGDLIAILGKELAVLSRASTSAADEDTRVVREKAA